MPEKIQDRLDVKNCLLTKGRSVPMWKSKGFDVKKISDVAIPKLYDDTNMIVTKDNEDLVKPVIVRYNGDIDEGDEICALDTQYPKLFIVNTGDIVISNIAASYGSIAVVPDELDGCVVSNEYTVLQPKGKCNPKVLKCILRSPEIRSEILLASTGSNRTRIQWENLKDIQLIYPDSETEKDMLQFIEESEKLESDLKRIRERAAQIAEDKFSLASDVANDILDAFKPPK